MSHEAQHKKDSKDLKSGDVCRLKSSGTMMTVRYIEENSWGIHLMHCNWFDINNIVQEACLRNPQLVPINERDL